MVESKSFYGCSQQILFNHSSGVGFDEFINVKLSQIRFLLKILLFHQIIFYLLDLIHKNKFIKTFFITNKNVVVTINSKS